MNCTVAGCERSPLAKGLCSAHYRQVERNGHVTSNEIRMMARTVREDGTLWCRTCRDHLPVANFARHLDTTAGYAYDCTLCAQSRMALRRYSITSEKYDEMLAAQGGGCAVCGRESDKRRLSVDHDHSCCPGKKSCGNCVRGLLCAACNTGLGMFRDDPDLLDSAKNYLVGTRALVPINEGDRNV